MKCWKKVLKLGTVLVVLVAVALSRASSPPPLKELAALASMALNPSSASRQRLSCETIASYAYSNHAGKYWLYHFGALSVIMNAMRRFRDDLAVQVACADGIGSLALFTKDIVEVAGERGAVELVVDIMRRWPEEPVAQIGGTHGCFMDLSPTNRWRWSQAGGMELNLAAIKRHFNDSGVQFLCWCAFSSGTQDPNPAKFGELGGIELSVEIMRAHGKSWRVREEVMQSNRAVGLRASWLRERQVAAGWIEEVVTAMKDAPLDMHQQSPGCMNLQILASNNASHRDRVVANGAVRLAHEAVKNFERMHSPLQWEYDGQYTVYYDCIGLLIRLAESQTAKEELVKAQAAQDVTEVMRKRPQDTFLQSLGSVLLGALSAA